MKLLALIILLVSIGPIARCDLLEQMRADGSIHKVAAPSFTDPSAAKAFGSKCRQLAVELQSNYSPTPELTTIHKQAAMAGEFLDGRAYTLKTTKVPSVVKLREWLKISPPDDIAYVKIYPSKESMPAFVQSAFTKEGTRGVTMDGRYVAIIQSKYPQEMQDVLSHEMVHCYLTLSSPKPLPKWFQEGVAVYLSTGKEHKFYGREAGIPEGVVSSLPEDYKGNLFIFSYLEEKVGQPKVYEFIRKSVETGNPDMRNVGFGFASPKQVASNSKLPIKYLYIGIGVLLVIGIAIIAWQARRREDF